MPISSISDTEKFDADIISAFYRDLIHSALEPLRVMGHVAEGEHLINEILITQEDCYIILNELKDGEHLLYLSVDKSSNPGLARVVIQRYRDQLNALL